MMFSFVIVAVRVVRPKKHSRHDFPVVGITLYGFTLFEVFSNIFRPNRLKSDI